MLCWIFSLWGRQAFPGLFHPRAVGNEPGQGQPHHRRPFHTHSHVAVELMELMELLKSNILVLNKTLIYNLVIPQKVFPQPPRDTLYWMCLEEGKNKQHGKQPLFFWLWICQKARLFSHTNQLSANFHAMKLQEKGKLLTTITVPINSTVCQLTSVQPASKQNSHFKAQYYIIFF